jgi:hypothetical protein
MEATEEKKEAELEITKRPIVAFVISKHKVWMTKTEWQYVVGVHSEIYLRKSYLRKSMLYENDNMFFNTSSVDDDEQIFAVSAPPGTLRVFGKFQDGSVHPIGYEIPGFSNPDWVEHLKLVREDYPNGKGL